ncbi:MAG: AAA family ATPase, partial [Waterburya sp.]
EYKGVKINNDYTLGIKQKSGDIVNPEEINFSPGEKEALAFAFIAGLNQASGKAAPLVMDTPFGHLDPTHKKNIINSLPELPSQVILLATGEDLPQNILDDLAPYIAQTHIISREGDNEFSSVIKVKK